MWKMEKSGSFMDAKQCNNCFSGEISVIEQSSFLQETRAVRSRWTDSECLQSRSHLINADNSSFCELYQSSDVYDASLRTKHVAHSIHLDCPIPQKICSAPSCGTQLDSGQDLLKCITISRPMFVPRHSEQLIQMENSRILYTVPTADNEILRFPMNLAPYFISDSKSSLDKTETQRHCENFVENVCCVDEISQKSLGSSLNRCEHVKADKRLASGYQRFDEKDLFEYSEFSAQSQTLTHHSIPTMNQLLGNLALSMSETNLVSAPIPLPIPTSTSHPSEHFVEMLSDVSDSDAISISPNRGRLRQYSHLQSDISDEENVSRSMNDTNNLNIVSKYSDISDACDSDASSLSDEALKDKINTQVKKAKTQRKSQYPMRSADQRDPKFKGVTVWLQTLFQNGKSRLKISAFYSNVRVGPSHSAKPPMHCFSENESSSPLYLTSSYAVAKTCASCKTRKTPLWRDAEDGTPLCNACGIRYKKYKLRCSKCWYIPKKDVKSYPNCPMCGSSLRYSFHRKVW